MLKLYLRRIFACQFYPTRYSNWYKEKGYVGESLQQQFADFLRKQSQKGALYFKEFQLLSLTRQFIPSRNDSLDSVLIIPNAKIAEGKAGQGVYFIFFQGRGEYYESRFRSMARQAHATGATILGFNPKGFNNSSGQTKELLDLVEDGIAVVRFLLDKGVDYKNIVFQGNSLGAGIQEMVAEYFKLNHGINFRQINSNSFKSLAAVVAWHYKVPFMENFFKLLLNYAGWEIAPGSDFYKTGPYRMYLRRKGDRTISSRAEFHSMVNHKADYELSPEGYKEVNKWLNERNQLIYTGNQKKDPHELGLHLFKINEKEKHSVFYMINKFLEASKDFL